jgi:uncharacterized membrane protein YraQ (UPF0718 family)
MSITDIIVLGAAAGALGGSALVSRAKTGKAVVIGAKQFWNVMPFFVAVFGFIGLLEVLLTPQQVQAFLGVQTGAWATLYAAVLGGLATGPPAAVFPLGAYLLQQHASMAAVATLLVAWIAVGTATLPAEIRFFGARFAFTRWSLTFVLSIGIGLIIGRLL